MKIFKKIVAVIFGFVLGIFFLVTSFAQEVNGVSLSGNEDENLFVEAWASRDSDFINLNFRIKNTGERDIDWATAKIVKIPEYIKYNENTVDFGSLKQSDSSEAVFSLSGGENLFAQDDDTADENSDSFAEEDGVSRKKYIYTAVIISVAIIVVIVPVFIIIKKKKFNGNGMAVISLVTAASLLTIGVCAEGAEAEHVVNINAEITMEGGVSFEMSFEILYGYSAEINSQPIMGTRRVSPRADYNIPKVSEKMLSPGAGPLGDQNIYIGTDGKYYFIGDTLEDYTGANLCRESVLDRYEKVMTERMSWLREQGIDFYFVICPNKNSVYSDIDPEKLEMADFRKIDQIVERLEKNTDINVIDLREALIEGKDMFDEGLYYKYDTHWNNYGGYLGYREIMKHISRDYPTVRTRMLSEYQIDKYETYMKDMLWYLGHYSAFEDYGPVFTLKSGMTAKLLSSAHDGIGGQYQFSRYWEDGYADYSNYLEYENENLKDAPRLYMIRDSFGISLVPFLKDSFSHSAFEWTTDFSKSAILNAKPDIVIFEIVERNMQEIISSRAIKD